MIDLSLEHQEQIREILRRQIPDRTAYIFGSRVRGRAKKFSDVDLAIEGKTPLTLQLIADLKEAFSSSALPFRIDILDWNRASDEFRRAIQDERQKIYEPSL